MNELYNNNSIITKNSLLKSGINIGKDILGTMINTLLFAYISGFMTLLISFNQLHYSFTDVLNKKLFCSEIFQILCSELGVILIVPITAFVTSEVLFIKSPFNAVEMKSKI